MIGWNKKYAEQTPKDKWVKEHAHLGKPEFLKAEYDKLVPPKEKEEPKKKSWVRFINW